MKAVFLNVVLIPLVGILGYIVARPRMLPHCFLPPELTEMKNYAFEHVVVKNLPTLNFSMKGEILRIKKPQKPVKSAKERAEKIIKNLKVSLIKGRKNYILIGPYFIEEGKEVKGIKFLKVDKEYVYIKIGNEIFKKRY